MIMRYVMLIVLAAASIWAVINASATNGEMLLVDAGQGAGQGDVGFWLLAGIATLITLSLCRFVIFGLPSMVGGWYQEHRPLIFMLICGGVLYGVVYLM
jgi:hypothetical protein